MNPATVENAIAAANQATAKDPSQTNPGLGPFDDAALAKARAASMGEGVTFVSADPIDTETAKGLSVVYAFRDVSKLLVSQRPDARLGLPSTRADQKIRFAFADNRRHLGAHGSHAGSPGFAPPRGLAGRPSQAGPQSRIPGHGAPDFPGDAASLGGRGGREDRRDLEPFVDGATVTLLDIDFGALLGDETELNQLRAARNGGSLEDLEQILKGVPGIKVTLDPEVRIEFAAK